MKKNTLLAAILGVAMLSAVPAHAQDSYVSVGAGRSEYRAEGFNENATTVSLAYGQRLGENWGYEIGYVNFGSGDVSGEEMGLPYAIKVRAQSLYLAAVGTLPLGEAFSIFGKAGVSANYVKASASTVDEGISYSGSESDTKLGPMLGFGAEYKITKAVAASIEYRYFHEVTDGDLKASTLTAGLSYNF